MKRFKDNGDSTVTDNKTGLMWLKDANYFLRMTWHQALEAVADLNLDWRLPNVNELHSLIDYSQFNPALPSGYPFANVQEDWYWTSTTYANYTDYAWFEDMRDGGVDYGYKGNGHYVWPVRGREE